MLVDFVNKDENLKNCIKEFLHQERCIKCLKQNDLDSLFIGISSKASLFKEHSKRNFTKVAVRNAVISYVTWLLYENGFFVENYITRVYPHQFDDIDKSEFVFPKCKSMNPDAFSFNDYVKSVEAPKLVDLGSKAFDHCSNLEWVKFPNLEFYYSDSFNGCKSLDESKCIIPSDAGLIEYVK